MYNSSKKNFLPMSPDYERRETFGNQLFKAGRKVSEETDSDIRNAIHNLPLGDVKKPRFVHDRLQ